MKSATESLPKTNMKLRSSEPGRKPIEFKEQVFCEDCGKPFADQKQMELHIAKIHGDRNFVCQLCSTGFRTDSILRNHIELHHQNQFDNLVCPQCHRVFSKTSSLHKHLKNHTFNTLNDKPATTTNPVSYKTPADGKSVKQEPMDIIVPVPRIKVDILTMVSNHTVLSSRLSTTNDTSGNNTDGYDCDDERESPTSDDTRHNNDRLEDAGEVDNEELRENDDSEPDDNDNDQINNEDCQQSNVQQDLSNDQMEDQEEKVEISQKRALEKSTEKGRPELTAEDDDHFGESSDALATVSKKARFVDHSSDDAVSNHRVINHNDGLRFVRCCESCSSLFFNESKYNEHMAAHERSQNMPILNINIMPPDEPPQQMNDGTSSSDSDDSGTGTGNPDEVNEGTPQVDNSGQPDPASKMESDGTLSASPNSITTSSASTSHNQDHLDNSQPRTEKPNSISGNGGFSAKSFEPSGTDPVPVASTSTATVADNMPTSTQKDTSQLVVIPSHNSILTNLLNKQAPREINIEIDNVLESTEAPEWICTKCHEPFTTVMQLMIHLIVHVKENQKNECAECDSISNRIDQASKALFDHIEAHNGDKLNPTANCATSEQTSTTTTTEAIEPASAPVLSQPPVDSAETPVVVTIPKLNPVPSTSTATPPAPVAPVVVPSTSDKEIVSVCAGVPVGNASSSNGVDIITIESDSDDAESVTSIEEEELPGASSNRVSTHFKCSKCGFSARCKNKVDAHVLIHEGEEVRVKLLHRCEKCKKAFPRRCLLMLHRLKHENKKPLKCEFCHRPFASQKHLNKHHNAHIKHAMNNGLNSTDKAASSSQTAQSTMASTSKSAVCLQAKQTPTNSLTPTVSAGQPTPQQGANQPNPSNQAQSQTPVLAASLRAPPVMVSTPISSRVQAQVHPQIQVNTSQGNATLFNSRLSVITATNANQAQVLLRPQQQVVNQANVAQQQRPQFNPLTGQRVAVASQPTPNLMQQMSTSQANCSRMTQQQRKVAQAQLVSLKQAYQGQVVSMQQQQMTSPPQFARLAVNHQANYNMANSTIPQQQRVQLQARPNNSLQVGPQQISLMIGPHGQIQQHTFQQRPVVIAPTQQMPATSSVMTQHRQVVQPAVQQMATGRSQPFGTMQHVGMQQQPMKFVFRNATPMNHQQQPRVVVNAPNQQAQMNQMGQSVAAARPMGQQQNSIGHVNRPVQQQQHPQVVRPLMHPQQQQMHLQQQAQHAAPQHTVMAQNVVAANGAMLQASPHPSPQPGQRAHNHHHRHHGHHNPNLANQNQHQQLQIQIKREPQ